jgi:hypothetical protein
MQDRCVRDPNGLRDPRGDAQLLEVEIMFPVR